MYAACQQIKKKKKRRKNLRQKQTNKKKTTCALVNSGLLNIKESAQTLWITEPNLQKKKSWLMESVMLTLQVVKAQQLDAYICSNNSSASRWKYISTRASNNNNNKKLTS